MPTGSIQSLVCASLWTASSQTERLEKIKDGGKQL
jgi:hypothetical protein